MRMLIVAVLITLAACTNASTQQTKAPDREAGRAVAFYSNSDTEYREAAQRADEWCHETYDAPAKYLGQRSGAAGNIVTFGCARN